MDQDFIQSGYFKTDFILFFSSAALNGFMMYSLTPYTFDSTSTGLGRAYNSDLYIPRSPARKGNRLRRQKF